MSILSQEMILHELKKGRHGDGLVITPLKLNQIGTISIDVHLGKEFIIFRRVSISAIDIGDSEKANKNIHKHQEKQRINEGDNFTLHPHQLVLGATREYIVLPEDLSASIVGRSTWGRTGLLIATATKIDPGFKGCITLELVNEGELPLVLYPGICVAQLILSRIEGNASYHGKYQYQTGPIFPNLKKEFENHPPFKK